MNLRTASQTQRRSTARKKATWKERIDRQQALLTFKNSKKKKKQLENYSFLGWLNNFLKLTNDTRSNLKNDDDNIGCSSDEEDEKDEMPAISGDGTCRMSDEESNASEWSF